MIFAIHWHESAMDLHVFPIPVPPPASLPIPSLWVFPVHQPWALVSCIQPGLVISFTLDSILVSMLFSQNIPPSPFSYSNFPFSSPPFFSIRRIKVFGTRMLGRKTIDGIFVRTERWSWEAEWTDIKDWWLPVRWKAGWGWMQHKEERCKLSSLPCLLSCILC